MKGYDNINPSAVYISENREVTISNQKESTDLFNRVKKRWICQSCKAITERNKKPIKCLCNKPNYEILSTEYEKSSYEAAIKSFEDENLLKLILEEISKSHIKDDHLKMTAFIVAVSGLLRNEKRRMSLAIRADSSTGKDNLIKSILNHIPEDTAIFLTKGSQATLEDDIKDKRIIAFSEVNKTREGGANKDLVEVIKQKTEGGTSSLKKDIRTGMKEARHDIGEQVTVFYGTTDAETDEELDTRFIVGNIPIEEEKIRTVNESTFDNFSNLDKLSDNIVKKDSWIRIGLNEFFSNEIQPEVVIPYAPLLKDKINDAYIFDYSSPRSQRDIKRVLSLTCAMTYLFQKQRDKIEYNGTTYIISRPQDLINVLQYSKEFFNQTYTGLDARLSEVVDVIKELKPISSDWVARDAIETRIGKSRNTIKKWCQALSGIGVIEGIRGSELNQQCNTNIYDGNKIYFKRCQKGVKKGLIRCELSELKKHLESKKVSITDTFLTDKVILENNNIDDKKGVNLDGVKMPPIQKNPENNVKKEEKSEIDTFSLTPFDFSKETAIEERRE